MASTETTTAFTQSDIAFQLTNCFEGNTGINEIVFAGRNGDQELHVHKSGYSGIKIDGYPKTLNGAKVAARVIAGLLRGA